MVRASSLPGDARCDAEFFKQRYLADDRLLATRNPSSLGEYAFVTDGAHGYHEVDPDSDIVMLTAQSANKFVASRDGADRIARWVDDANKRSALEAGDLILSTRGTVGKCALVLPEVLPANLDQDIARIALYPDAPIQPEVLATYINSSFGQDHITRYSTGMVQQGISLAKVRQIPIPRFTEVVQNAVRGTIREAIGARDAAASAQRAAEGVLLDALGLRDFTPDDPLTYTRPATAARAAGRLDAQYFAPKHDVVLKRLQDTGSFETVAQLCSIVARGRQPLYAEEGRTVINSRHVLRNKIVINDGNRRAAASGHLICSGDVLVNGTGVGTIGRAAAYLLAEAVVPDNHVTILRAVSIDPVYLALFLNCVVGRSQLERMIKGSSGQIELYPDDIGGCLVWLPPSDIEAEIVASMEASAAAEQRSFALLARAKRAVEVAVEAGEAAALAVLDA